MYITAPSTGAPLNKLRLNLLGAQASRANGLLPQFDAFVKAAVTLVPDVLALPELDVSAPDSATIAARGARRLARWEVKTAKALSLVFPILRYINVKHHSSQQTPRVLNAST